MLRTATLSAVLLLAPLAASAEVALSGFMQQNTAFNTVEQNPDGRLQEGNQHGWWGALCNYVVPARKPHTLNN